MNFNFPAPFRGGPQLTPALTRAFHPMAPSRPDLLVAYAAPATLATKGRAMRCTVLGFTSNLAAVLRTLCTPPPRKRTSGVLWDLRHDVRLPRGPMDRRWQFHSRLRRRRFAVARAAYRAACRRWPEAKITLRQGARVVERNWSTSEAAN